MSRRLTNKILRAWAGKENSGPFLIMLSGLSLFYSLAITIRNFLYDSGILAVRRLACSVISIGNITVGGTGKTPAAIMIAGLLKEHGYRPAVLSRGYGGKGKDIKVVSDGRQIFGCAYEAGDEPHVIARAVKVPVVTSPDRYAAGLHATGRLGADVLVLDDAFQHRSLHRDINIALLDAARPFGNGFLLPRGPLREGPASLERADLVVLTRSDSGPVSVIERLKAEFPSKTFMRARHEPESIVECASGASHPVTFISGKKVAAFCGIAQPGSFRRLIENLGAEVVFFEEFKDHHSYTPGDVDRLREASRAAAAEMVLTTEKDFTKLERSNFPGLFTLRIKIAFEDPGFPQWLMSRLKK